MPLLNEAFTRENNGSRKMEQVCFVQQKQITDKRLVPTNSARQQQQALNSSNGLEFKRVQTKERHKHNDSESLK